MAFFRDLEYMYILMENDTVRHILAAMLAEKTQAGEPARNEIEREKSVSELLALLLALDAPPGIVSQGLSRTFDAAGKIETEMPGGADTNSPD